MACHRRKRSRMHRAILFAALLPSLCFAAPAVAPISKSSTPETSTGKTAALSSPKPGQGRGAPELRICSQNLHNFGLPPPKPKASGKGKKNSAPKETPAESAEHLITRMVSARCDIIGAQEVGGAHDAAAKRNLSELATQLSKRSGRTFRTEIGDAAHGPIRNGLLVAEDTAEILRLERDAQVNLPKLQPLGPARRAPRAPLGALLQLKPRTGAAPRKLYLVNVHFKSKVEGWKDPTQTDFETTRMESAEAVRLMVESAPKRYGADVLVAVMGDLNTEPDGASSHILSGKRHLADFQSDGQVVSSCGIDKQLRPLCRGMSEHREMLRPLFPGGSGSGTFLYRGRPIILDQIFIPPSQEWIFSRDDGSVAAGLEGTFRLGSDHKLLWAELNW